MRYKLLYLLLFFEIIACRNYNLGENYISEENNKTASLFFTSDSTFKYTFHFDHVLIKSSGTFMREKNLLVLNSYRKTDKIPLNINTSYDSNLNKNSYILNIKNRNKINYEMCYYSILVNGRKEYNLDRALLKNSIYPKDELRYFSIKIYSSIECGCYNQILKSETYHISDTSQNIINVEIDLLKEDFDYTNFENDSIQIRKKSLKTNFEVYKLVPQK